MQITPVLDSNGKIASYIAIKRDVTERRAAEEAQRLLAAIVETSGGCNRCLHTCGCHSQLEPRRGSDFWLFGPRGNREAGIHAGRKAGRAGTRFSERVLHGHVVSQYEGLCLSKDGRKIHVSVTNGSPYQKLQRRSNAVSAILRDVSERHAGEEARALLASIVRSSDAAVYGVTPDGSIVSWNRGAEVLFGYSSQEIIGKNAGLLAPPGCSSELTRLPGKHPAGAPSALSTQFSMQRMDAVRMSRFNLTHQECCRQVLGASGIAHAIGQRIQAERRLRESEARFRDVFENAPFGMCVTAIDGRFLQGEPGAYPDVGIFESGSPGHVVGRN